VQQDTEIQNYCGDLKSLMDLHILRPPGCKKVISGMLFFCMCGQMCASLVPE
jgi:hypothetical protein